MTVTTRQVMELADGRRGVRDRYVCSFPGGCARLHAKARLIEPVVLEKNSVRSVSLMSKWPVREGI